MHTLIVGNGILGMTIAFRLLQRIRSGDRISVLGKRSRPGSATLAAAAMQASFAEVEVNSLVEDIDLFRFELSYDATRLWPEFERELIDAAGDNLPDSCSKCEIHTGGCFGKGTYVVNNTAADNLDDANFNAIVKALEDFNEQFDFVDPKSIPNYMPEERFRATRALYIHNEGWFNPRIMIDKLEAILSNHPQVDLIDDEAVNLSGANSEISHVEIRGKGKLEADYYVLANGSMLTSFLTSSNIEIDIQPVFHGIGASIEIKGNEFPHTKCIRTPNRGWACGIYTVPYFLGPGQPNDHILVGASSFLSATPHDRVRLASVENLMRAAMEQINRNFYRADLVRVNVGSRPTSQDTYPLLGKTTLRNLSVASGTNRDGFHLAPVISKMIVDQIHGDDVDERYNYFTPEREPIRKYTREEAISDSVRHQISALYQHDFNPAKGRMDEQIARMYREDLERLHDRVGAYDWGIPPMMIDMYRYDHARY
jgi:glycine/D-amino acid oxidase-like deaminating enzyme